MSKTLSKYIDAFDYIDKTLTVLSETSWGISIISFRRNIGVPVGIASASCARNEKKKLNKIIILDKSKLDSTETLICQALINREISLEKFKTIANEKEKYDRMKESISNINSNDEKELTENS